MTTVLLGFVGLPLTENDNPGNISARLIRL